MPACITIQSGIAAGTSHMIDGRVARVGSDPQSDVCLPTADVPEHALTLEFREDGCLVYNRCRDNIYIGALSVSPEQVVHWPETDILQLGGQTELLLDMNVDSLPNGATNFAEEEFDSDSAFQQDEATEPNADAADEESKTGSATLMMQLGVTVVCLVAGALLLLRDQNRVSGSVAGPEFSEVISAGMGSNAVAPELIQRIQYAEAQRVRGRKKVAATKFQRIRDDLVARRDQSPDSPHALILGFVQSRLGSDDLD